MQIWQVTGSIGSNGHHLTLLPWRPTVGCLMDIPMISIRSNVHLLKLKTRLPFNYFLYYLIVQTVRKLHHLLTSLGHHLFRYCLSALHAIVCSKQYFVSQPSTIIILQSLYIQASVPLFSHTNCSFTLAISSITFQNLIPHLPQSRIPPS